MPSLSTTPSRPLRFAWDCDQVLADFDSHVKTLTGRSPDDFQKAGVSIWRELEQHQRFFRDLDPIPNMIILALGYKALVPTRVITGRPRKDTMPFAEEDKRLWLHNQLGSDVEVIVCLARHKHHHISVEYTDVLIDDNASNIQNWERAGGIGILHTSYEDTFTKLHNLFKAHNK